MLTDTNIDLLDFTLPSTLRTLFSKEPDDVNVVRLKTKITEDMEQHLTMLRYIKPVGTVGKEIDCSFKLMQGSCVTGLMDLVEIYPEELPNVTRELFSFMYDDCMEYFLSLFNRFIGANAYQGSITKNSHSLRIHAGGYIVVITNNLLL